MTLMAEPLLKFPILCGTELQYHFVPAGVTREVIMATISCAELPSRNRSEFI